MATRNKENAMQSADRCRIDRQLRNKFALGLSKLS